MSNKQSHIKAIKKLIRKATSQIEKEYFEAQLKAIKY